MDMYLCIRVDAASGPQFILDVGRGIQMNMIIWATYLIVRAWIMCKFLLYTRSLIDRPSKSTNEVPGLRNIYLHLIQP